MTEFLDKWGKYVKVDGYNVVTKNSHLINRWKHVFESDVEKMLGSDYKIVYQKL